MVGQTSVRVWDVPTRLFHWLYAGAFTVAFLSHDSSRALDVHVFAGYVFAALLVFRVAWGLIGTRYARFRDFAYGWTGGRDYLRGLMFGRPRRFVGHNPLGAWAIFALLGLGAAIAITGLLALGGQERHGPFAGALTFAAGERLVSAHAWLAWALLGLVALHILGVVVESVVHRENLALAMVTGRKRGGTNPVAPYRLLGAALLAGLAAAGWYSFRGYAYDTPERPYRPFVSAALPQHSAWQEECGGCHLPYHPALLPARSWRALLAGQTDHFGEDLALTPQTLAALGAYAERNAAEAALSEAAWYIGTTTPTSTVPLRITRTAYWQERHAGIQSHYWRSAEVEAYNCDACHFDAADGTFEDAAMRLPPPKAMPQRLAMTP